jgi:hypothetical protein
MPCPRRNALLAILLLAAPACTEPNPRFRMGVAEPSDGPLADAGGSLPADATAGPPPADLAVEAIPADATGSGPAAQGAPCSGPGGCQSGFCVDGVCCDTACRERCRSCALPSSPGTCALIPAGADPRLECPAQDPETCGRAGGCDGQGECQLHPTGTECRAQSCTNGVQLSPSLCTGSGACTPGSPKACALPECNGDRCAVACTSNSCPSGFQCQASKCASLGPALHWRFDDGGGASAVDASPNGFTGTYRGQGSALPTPSTAVPRTNYPNPRSLNFGPTGVVGVELSPIPSLLKPPTTVTVTVWYRATRAAALGSDLVNVGDDYLLRLRATNIEFVKRRSDVPGMLYQLATLRNVSGHLDGQWHHLTGVISPTAVHLYLDGGILHVSSPNSDPILYRGSQMWVGRDTDTDHAFQGDLDDLRIYARDLSPAEIQQLAKGEP